MTESEPGSCVNLLSRDGIDSQRPPLPLRFQMNTTKANILGLSSDSSVSLQAQDRKGSAWIAASCQFCPLAFLSGLVSLNGPGTILDTT
jgi:hypothetical protein